MITVECLCGYHEVKQDLELKDVDGFQEVLTCNKCGDKILLKVTFEVLPNERKLNQ